MKNRRRLLIAGAAVPLVLILFLALVPLLFRGRIEAAVQARIAQSVNAEVTWGDIGVSLLRDFPNATFSIGDVAIVGVNAFAGDTLLSVARLRAELDLASAWRSLRGSGALLVRGIDVERPAVRLVTLEDGRSSWDVLSTATRNDTDGEGKRVDIMLRRLAVTDGRVLVDDRSTGLAVSVSGLDHSLNGDFGRQRVTLRSRTSGDSVSVRFAGIPYLSRAAVSVEADVAADMAARQFTLRDNVIRINALELRSQGTLALHEDGGTIDLAFEAPRTAFADILSLVPALYARSFETLETAGAMRVAGRISGPLGDGAFPGFELTARVDDGRFRYPDLPLPARDIAFDLAVTNPGGSPDSTVVRVERMHIVLGADPIEGALVLRTPVSDPDVDVRVAGRLDLENVGRTLKLERMQELSGVVVADARMRTRQSDMDARRFERVSASGSIELTQVALQPQDGRPVTVEHALVRLTPAHAELVDLRARSGNTDVAISGTVDNLLGFALGRDVLRGDARVTSSYIDLNEWRSDDEARAVPVPANIDVTVRAEIARVTLGTLDMRNARGALRVSEQRATLDGFRVDMLGGSMAVSGWYETIDPARPRFDVDLAVADFDVPTAFASLATMRALAPVAGYARGSMSADLKLSGALGADLSPQLDVMSGDGRLETRNIVVQDFPVFERLADRLSVEQLRDPALRDLKSSFEIRGGRLHVKPFDVGFGPLAMAVSGSNGFDQSLDYQLALQLPRAVMGADANRVLATLASQTQRAGLDLEAAQTIGVGVRVTGNVRDPQLGLDLRDAAGSTAERIQQALRDRADAGVAEITQRADSAADEARRRAEAEAARIVAEAEERAAEIREQARALAERAKQEGYARADSLAARATSPAARIAARAAADRLRSEADAQAERITREADERANALVEEARRRAAAQPPG